MQHIEVIAPGLLKYIIHLETHFGDGMESSHKHIYSFSMLIRFPAPVFDLPTGDELNTMSHHCTYCSSHGRQQDVCQTSTLHCRVGSDSTAGGRCHSIRQQQEVHQVRGWLPQRHHHRPTRGEPTTLIHPHQRGRELRHPLRVQLPPQLRHSR